MKRVFGVFITKHPLMIKCCNKEEKFKFLLLSPFSCILARTLSWQRRGRGLVDALQFDYLEIGLFMAEHRLMRAQTLGDTSSLELMRGS